MKRRLDERALAPDGTNVVAFSGGPDSVCLLHLLVAAGLGDRLRAVHVDHGLDPGSSERAAAAVDIARRIGVVCRVETLQPAPGPTPGGPEASARHARYRRLRACLDADDHLLTAHHADDQVETLLLRLFRGAGPVGLSGMRVLRRLGTGWLGRPLLEWTRDDILDYVETHRLDTVYDPTNDDLSLDRNYLRRRILPAVADRWPGYRAAVGRCRSWQSTAAVALGQQAETNWRALAIRRGAGELVLDLPRWLALPDNQSFAVIRYWCDLAAIAAPPIARLASFRHQCRTANPDRQPLLEWDDAQCRAFDGQLLLDRAPLPPDRWSVDWNPDETVRVPAGGELELRDPGPDRPTGRWAIGSPPAGGRIRTARNRPRQRVTELLREAGIPPWRRSALPALFIDGELVGIAPDWLDAGFAEWLGQAGAGIEWHDRPVALLPCLQSP